MISIVNSKGILLRWIILTRSLDKQLVHNLLQMSKRGILDDKQKGTFPKRETIYERTTEIHVFNTITF